MKDTYWTSVTLHSGCRNIHDSAAISVGNTLRDEIFSGTRSTRLGHCDSCMMVATRNVSKTRVSFSMNTRGSKDELSRSQLPGIENVTTASY
jgi:hypothetical protein